MPYSDPIKRREYARKWMAARRAEYFEGKVCAWCGSTEDLQLDHLNPKDKVDHKIWSWAREKREAELAKCQSLCRPCHDKKSKAESAKGEKHGHAILKAEDVIAIRASKEPRQVLAYRYNVSPETIKTVRAGRTWKHI